MSVESPVTVLCATLNAREAVRLTFASFRRHTPEPCQVLVADNGSTDGTLNDLRAIPWLTVISLDERRTLMRAEAEQARAAVAALEARLHALGEQLPAKERALLTALGAAMSDVTDDSDPALTLHGATLDWLSTRVQTPFFLTLDSDVEFLARGWLSEMLELMERDRLDALGEYLPGHDGYRARLGPHVLLLRTSAFRALGASFRSFVRIEDPEEARRWQARPRSFHVDLEELAGYRTAALYATGAGLFERLERAGARWAALPRPLAAKFLHLGHMSWAANTRGELPGAVRLRDDHAARLAYVRERLRLYAEPKHEGLAPRACAGADGDACIRPTPSDSP